MKKTKEFGDYKTIKEKITFLLETDPSLRDNDLKLISTFHFNQIGKEEVIKMSAFDFLNRISNGEIISSDSVSRIKRMVQEENENLRGKFYKHKKPKLKFQYIVRQK